MMAETPKGDRWPLVVGVNHRSSSMVLRDRVFMEDVEVPAFLECLRAAGVEEALVLSTCDRVEVQAMHADPDAATGWIMAALAERGGVDVAELDSQAYALRGETAVRHIFMVTGALDSLVVGEPHVLGQVKAGHRLARAAGMVDGRLEALLQAAYGSAKRVRTETSIGERPVSIAAAAAELVAGLHGELNRVSGVLIGVGDMGQLIAEQMLAEGVRNFTVTHPTRARAEALARMLNCHHAAYDQLSELLVEGDIIVCALGRRSHAITAEMIHGVLGRRRHRPMFVVDTAVPGDVEPAIDRVDRAFVYDIGDLERVALEGRAGREQEAEGARRIVDDEVTAFQRGRAERAAVPAVSQLRVHIESLRKAALADAGTDAEKATRLLIGRLLQRPSEVLRRKAFDDAETLAATERLLLELFGLNCAGGGSDDNEGD